jgi:hypothetical protein
MDTADDEADASALLAAIGFDPEESALTERQAQVLLLRERGRTQTAIAEMLGTSRANVANVEASARANVAKARETLRVVRAMEAPVRVPIPAGADIYEVPETVYEACNEADIKVAYSAPELVRRLLDDAESVVDGRTIEVSLTLHVTEDGEVVVRRTDRDR